MPNTVSTVEVIVLQDDTEVHLRPLNIKNQRLFMKKINELVGMTENPKYLKDGEKGKKVVDVEAIEEDGEQLLIDATAICINNKKEHNELVNDRDRLEEALDMPTIYRIIKVCGNVELNPENLVKMSQENTPKAQG